MPENLVQHRGQPSVWDHDRNAYAPRWLDASRLGAMAAAGVLLLAGVRGRSKAGRIVSLASGACLAWWAATSHEARRQHLIRVREACVRRGRQQDLVNEAAEESFPASDAPAFTPATRPSGWANGSRSLWPLRR